jgi:hypothetical protein
MYECIIVEPYREAGSILDEEGDLDNESDASEIDMDEFRSRRDSSSYSVTSSTREEVGSPMIIEDSE